jgi:general nucleoside transport system permease protein
MSALADQKAPSTGQSASRRRWLRVEQRETPSGGVWHRGIAVVVGLGLGTLYLATQAHLESSLSGGFLNTVWVSTLGSPLGISQLLELSTPLIIAGCAAAVTQRVGLWNLGIQGQGIMGAWVATLGAFALPDLPTALLLPLMIVLGMVGGTLWMLGPALARAYLRVDEVITTLMLNFVAGLWIAYWATGPWLDKAQSSGGALFSRNLSDNATFPQFDVGGTKVSLAFPLAIAAAVLVWALFRYTRYGYRTLITAGGERPALYVGIRPRRIHVSVLLISGAIGGLMGVVLMVDQVHSFSTPLSEGNEGYVGIVVALIAGNYLLATIPSGVLMGLIAVATGSLQIAGVAPSSVYLLTGLVLILVASANSLARYRIRIELRPSLGDVPAKAEGERV